jgi:hypothetical protein
LQHLHVDSSSSLIAKNFSTVASSKAVTLLRCVFVTFSDVRRLSNASFAASVVDVVQ